MPAESDKLMFEIYRESGYNGRCRAVYFTELNEHNKESEINRALAGDHIYDGFIRAYGKEEAQRIIEELLDRLNSGEALGPEEIEASLREYLV